MFEELYDIPKVWIIGSLLGFDGLYSEDLLERELLLDGIEWGKEMRKYLKNPK